ncbi:MAG: cyclase family protein [Methylocystaceae bacterium]
MIIDLTQTLEEGMPIYPGTESPVFETPITHEQFGYQQTRLRMLSHVGTHLDCPAHVYPQGLSTDRMPVEQFYGSGVVVDCRHLSIGSAIDNDLMERMGKAVRGKDFILFYTGWDKKWGTEHYFSPYPSFSEEAITTLVKMNIKGIGVDVISIDPIDATKLNNHLIFLQGHKVAIENLRGIDQLIDRDFKFVCFPLKIRNGDGSPIRAVAIV